MVSNRPAWFAIIQSTMMVWQLLLSGSFICWNRVSCRASRNSSPCRKSWVRLRIIRTRSQSLRGCLLTTSRKITRKMKVLIRIPAANSRTERKRNTLLTSQDTVMMGVSPHDVAAYLATLRLTQSAQERSLRVFSQPGPLLHKAFGSCPGSMPK